METNYRNTCIGCGWVKPSFLPTMTRLQCELERAGARCICGGLVVPMRADGHVVAGRTLALPF